MDAERRRAVAEREMGTVTPLGLVALAAAYFALSILVWQFASPDETGAPWWPAAGLTLGVMCRVRTPAWPAVALTIFAADFAADLVQGTPVATSAAWATSNTIEPLLGAWALRRVFDGRLPNFSTPVNTVKFFGVAAVAGAPLASMIGSLASSFTYDQQFLDTWLTWYVGDVLGILVVAPLVLYSHQLRSTFGLRLALVLIATAGVSLLVFGTSDEASLLRPYLVTPVLIAAAFSCGAPGAAAAGLTTATISVVLSSLGYGPFALDAPDEQRALVQLQLFTAIQLLTVYLLVAIRSQTLSAEATVERLGEEKLRDPLTGVGNRLKLDEALIEVTSEPEVGAVMRPAAALFLDLDDFKPINDELGHDAGDAVLVHVADRLTANVRGDDVVARVGGDEFAVICPDISEAATRALAERLERALAEPFTIGARTLRIGVSIGQAWIPAPTGRPADLLRRADTAMYEVKSRRHAGRSRAAQPAASS